MHEPEAAYVQTAGHSGRNAIQTVRLKVSGNPVKRIVVYILGINDCGFEKRAGASAPVTFLKLGMRTKNQDMYVEGVPFCPSWRDRMLLPA